MTSEPHDLILTSRKNQITFDGKCTCLKWRVINRPRADIREQHARHVQERIGPDGKERKNV